MQLQDQRLVDVSESLASAREMLEGVDVLLAAGSTPAAQRSARALLSLAADLVAQAGELANALQH